VVSGLQMTRQLATDKGAQGQSAGYRPTLLLWGSDLRNLRLLHYLENIILLWCRSRWRNKDINRLLTRDGITRSGSGFCHILSYAVAA
jgi:hypothetical protein